MKEQTQTGNNGLEEPFPVMRPKADVVGAKARFDPEKS
jgi:hypothetical protein